MADKLRVGLVGANASGGSWSSVAHIPAMRAVRELELAAVCTRRPESAEAAAKAFNIERHYHDVTKLVDDPTIDIVAVIVKVPGHFDAVSAALSAGKHVYCEWPLGGDLEQTRAMAELCRDAGVIGAVGLQGRHDPHLRLIKSLYEDGWFGDLLSVDMSMVMKGTPREDRGPAVPGASMFAIAGGHTIDLVTNAFGPIASLTARVAQAGASNGRKEMPPGTLDESADSVLLHAALSNGALLSAQVAEVPDHNTGWRMTVHGTEGTVEASTSILPQISPITLRGAKVGQEMAEMTPPTITRSSLRQSETEPVSERTSTTPSPSTTCFAQCKRRRTSGAPLNRSRTSRPPPNTRCC
jgi:predicted dehydrogenase